MYKIVKNKSKNDPFYRITFEYSIGDAEGYSNESIEFDKKEFEDNLVLQEVLHTLQKFITLEFKGHRGCMFDPDYLKLAKPQMTPREIEILEANFDEEGNEDLIYFSDCIKNECEYAFFFIDRILVEYIDENNKKHEVIWED